MGWTAYRLVYQAKSPIHIGYHKLGFIQRTRYYIPGRVMWGALTANLTRTFFDYPDYAGVGSLLKSKILVSYFYPALKQNETQYETFLPQFGKQGLQYGSFLADKFESLFIHSFGQTAIEPENNTAEDKSLHETEYIAPVVDIKGNQEDVFFVGYIFVNFVNDVVEYNGKKLSRGNINSAISEIQVGGERKYGFGRLVLKKELLDAKKVFGFEFVSDGDKPAIKLEKYKPIPAHLEIDNPMALKGYIKPLVGREWGIHQKGKDKYTGAGQRISSAQICWVPGSILEKEEELKIQPYGILSILRRL